MSPFRNLIKNGWIVNMCKLSLSLIPLAHKSYGTRGRFVGVVNGSFGEVKYLKENKIL